MLKAIRNFDRIKLAFIFALEMIIGCCSFNFEAGSFAILTNNI